ncbi:inositol polyphosphate phosphatase [Chloropicon primus]|uniref:Inositol polyphosphate phosphatase n=1 Tax=Chloropicon primus TaxID=1764295 RepID=A0A5B8MGJ3_9CHLO|nr:inositol polyphosphate phosphatase [Chloropicon primus]UPQ98761.1 inositol polyphosphate phosphatase [Chloropicon primus]|eukprot:QDZ19549.1 inositol polyphosphate phosphatase [Chloropicon primus]
MAAMGDLSLRIHVVTWNMNSRLPSDGIPESLLMLSKDPETLERCVYAVGVQEGSQVGTWSEYVLSELGDPFMLIGEGNIGGIHLAIFVTEDIVKDYEFDIETDIVSCGIGNIYWNKGAVGFLVKIQSLKLLFVNSHLAAQQDKVDQRNQDYHRITSELFKEKAEPGTKPNIEDLADLIFWCGDFNYRIEGNRKSVDYLLKKGMMNVLLANDQLQNEIASKRAFVDYVEGGINFLPTYKFDNGTDNYDTSSKQRVPSWTDRILWKVCDGGAAQNVEVVLWLYDAVRGMKSSDHRPVIGVFDVHTSTKKVQKSLDAVLGEQLKRPTLQVQRSGDGATQNEVEAVTKILELSKSQRRGRGEDPGIPGAIPGAVPGGESESEPESEPEPKDGEGEVELAREMLKEPIPLQENLSILQLQASIDDLFAAFSSKVNVALDLFENAQAKKARGIVAKVESMKANLERARPLEKGATAVAASGGEPESEEKVVVEKATLVEEVPKIHVGTQKDLEDETINGLYQKISELRTEIYQEKRTHMQTKAKLEIMNRKLNKHSEDEEGGGGVARRRSSVSTIATAKVMQARMRKKQSKIYG